MTDTETISDYSDTYDPDADFDRYYTEATARRIVRSLRPGDRVLELGCATGLMSSMLAPALGDTGRLVSVDWSATYLEKARARGIANAEFVPGNLEQLPELGGDYQHLVVTGVLHELHDPETFLRTVSKLLAETGTLHLTVQNPDSIHRLCAVELGMIDSVLAVSDRGVQWNTRGMWTADQLVALAARAGLETWAREGIMLKPLPNSLMAALPVDVIEGFIRVADQFPEHSAMTYLQLRRPGHQEPTA